MKWTDLPSIVNGLLIASVVAMATFLLRARDRLNSLEQTSTAHTEQIGDLKRSHDSQQKGIQDLQVQVGKMDTKLDILINHFEGTPTRRRGSTA